MCRQVDPDMWYPDFSRPGSRAEQNTAKKICWLLCPVREVCLTQALVDEWGMSLPDRRREGIRGGFTPADRADWERRERDRRRRVADRAARLAGGAAA